MSQPTIEELNQLSVTLTITRAGEILGIGRSAAYAAAQRGEIPTVRIGGRLVVPTAKLRTMLGIER